MRKYLAIFMVLCSTFIAAKVSAATYKFIFWYPGEAGSSGVAQPIIDQFFDHINKNMGGDKIEGKYFPTEAGGRAYIAAERPLMGVVSLISYAKEGNRTGMTVVARTRPLPGGTTTQKYYLVGSKEHQEKGTVPASIFSSEPMTAAFAKNALKLPVGSATITQTVNTLGKLKAIANGEDVSAILTEVEHRTLKNTKAEWAAQIATIAGSASVPTAPLVAFGKGPGDPVISKISSILMKMSGDSSAKEILSTLRFAGFSPGGDGEYQAIAAQAK